MKRNLFFLTLLVGSFLFPPSRLVWDAIDVYAFRMLNGLLEYPTLVPIIGKLNTRAFDWASDLIIFLLLLPFFFEKGCEPLSRRLARFLYLIAVGAFIIAFINEYFIAKVITVRRNSPTVCLENTYRLSEMITEYRVKDSSVISFPSGHATPAWLLIFYAIHLRGLVRALPSICYGIFMMLPRLIGGAHWLSDALVGTLTITALSLTIALHPIIYTAFTAHFESAILLFSKRKHKQKTATRYT